MEGEEYKNFLESLPKKRMASGLLILDEDHKVLLLQPSYKPNWEIPGGIVEADESPLQTCKREALEEIGLNQKVQSLLTVDYIFAKNESTESIHFVFYGGVMNKTEIKNIRLDGKEIIAFSFLSLDEIKKKAKSSLYNRIIHSLDALEKGKIVYLESQQSIF